MHLEIGHDADGGEIDESMPWRRRFGRLRCSGCKSVVTVTVGQQEQRITTSSENRLEVRNGRSESGSKQDDGFLG